MATLIVLFVALYVLIAIIWLAVTALHWSVDREYPMLHDKEDIAAKAQLVLMTPIWPLPMLDMIRRALKNLSDDAVRGTK